MTSPAHHVFQHRITFAILFLVILAGLFWSSSRYPDLDEKAMMSGAIQLEDPLSFEAVLYAPVTDPFYKRVAYSTVNWLHTNRLGMTFGIFFAAGFLTLLTYLKSRSFNQGWKNSFAGMILGAPLGVCVNCAAPITKGLYAGGARVETTLSAMIASPSLNVVVLTMLFSLFPLHIAVAKVALSVLVILVCVPVLARVAPAKAQPMAGVCDIGELVPDYREKTTLKALYEFTKDYVKHWWYIVRTTLPLMFLAGFLGAIVATAFPPDLIAQQPFSLAILALTAILGTFAPVPIGFDVVFSAILLNSGLDIAYVMTLLFSLGIFSVYSYFIVSTTIGLRIANALFLTIVLLSITAGWAMQQYNHWLVSNALEELVSENTVGSNNAPPETQPLATKTSLRQEHATEKAETNVVTITQHPFKSRGTKGSTSSELFTGVEAWTRGIDKPLEFSMHDMWPPFWEGRSVATGDFDKDGDNDVVLASTVRGLYIYKNDGDGSFTENPIAAEQVSRLPVFNAALVDIDNDGWLDLFITTYQQGNYWIQNQDGEFRFDQPKPVLNQEDAILTMAVSFGDVDGDGYLDAALGNWAAGWYRRIPGEESRNRIVYNDNGRLTGQLFTKLDGLPGETLSILLTDLNHDSALDLLVGNDFDLPDVFYHGDSRGNFTLIQAADKIYPHSTTTTMSLKTADLTNNGKTNIYAAQIAGRAQGVSDRLNMQPISAYCSGIKRTADRDLCQRNMNIKTWYRAGNSFNPSYADKCAQLPGEYQHQCRGMLVKDLAIQKNDPAVCDLIPADQLRASQLCAVHFLPRVPPTLEDMERQIPQILGRNVLLVEQANGSYADKAVDYDLDVGGWSWDVKIGDFNNDEWQDIYIVNGTWVPNEVTPSNIYYQNNKGTGFEELSQPLGLQDYLMTAAASQFDIDGDGDLDLLTIPVNAPVKLYVNNSSEGNIISFEFRDTVANHYGIGAKVDMEYGGNKSLRQTRELQLGGGFMSFDAPQLHFGLGPHTVADRATIRWPDGSTTILEGPLRANRRYTVHREATSTGR